MKTGTAMNKAIPRTKKEKSDRKKFNKKRWKHLKDSIENLNEQTKNQKEESKPVIKIRKRTQNETKRSTNMGRCTDDPAIQRD